MFYVYKVAHVARHVERKWYQIPFASLFPAKSCNHGVAPCVSVVMLLHWPAYKLPVCRYRPPFLLSTTMPTRSGASYRIIMSSSPQVNPSDGTPHSPLAQVDPGLGDAGNPAVPDHPVGAANVANGPSTGELAGIHNAGPSSAGRGLNAIPEHGTSLLRLPNESMKLFKFKGDVDLSNASDFIFDLELYIDATPGLSSTMFEREIDSRALKSLLATISGCFPPGSVSAVWFRNAYRLNQFTSFPVFRDLFLAQFQQSASDVVTLQNRWEDAAQRRHQNAHEYYRFLLQLQSQIASIAPEAAPTPIALANKYCASVRHDLKRYLQEKRIDHPDYSITQLVSAAGVRENALRGKVPAPDLATMQGSSPGTNERKWCFFCKSHTHNASDCRKIAAKKAAGQWRERRPRQGKS
jgi:hypothetical protein